jgi:WD40 repeat protein
MVTAAASPKISAVLARASVLLFLRGAAAVACIAWPVWREVAEMKALKNMTTPRGRSVVACALGVLVMACGGSDEAASSSAATAATTASLHDAAMAAAAAQSVPQRKMPRGRVLRGITAMDVAADGSVAMAGADGSVQIQSDKPVDNGRERAAMSKMADASGVAATAVAFSADGKHLVGVGRDSVVNIWSVASRTRLMSLHGHEHPIRSVAVSADGAYVATVGEETRVMLWNAATGKLAKILGGHVSFVNTVAFSPNGRMLATGDATGKVVIWNLANGAPRHQLAAHTDEVNSVAFSPDGLALATAGEDGRVVLWSTDNGQKLQSLEGHKGPVRALAFSKDGEWLASGGEEGKVLVWDMGTRRLSNTFVSSAALNTLVFDTLKRKQVLLAGDEDGRVSKWDVAAGVPR